MRARPLESLDLTPARTRSPRSIWVAVAAYVGADRLDDGARLSPPLSCSREPPAPWLTCEQNERLAQQHANDGALDSSPSEIEAAVDARASWKTIEIFAALLPIGWG